jgi:hypothetical protein
MAPAMLLIVRTPLRRYVVRRDDVFDIKLIPGPEALADNMLFDRPVVGVELGMLLDPADRGGLTRRRALLVPLLRRYVALLVDNVDAFLEQVQCVPLPPLLSARLGQPWAVGALALEDELLVQLDLRAIARSVLAGRSGESRG